MRAHLSRPQLPKTERPVLPPRTESPSEAVLGPLFAATRSGGNLVSARYGSVESPGQEPLWRFVLIGQRGGADPIRLGLFSALGGHERREADIAASWLLELDRQPELARDYVVCGYPVTNPTGLDAGTVANHAGHELTREIWQGSSQSEVYYLERELGVHRFNLVVVLRRGAHARSLRVLTESPVVFRELLHSGGWSRPTSEASGDHPVVSVLRDDAVLTDTDELSPRPLELVVETPLEEDDVEVEIRVHAFLRELLDGYRSLQCYCASL